MRTEAEKITICNNDPDQQTCGMFYCPFCVKVNISGNVVALDTGCSLTGLGTTALRLLKPGTEPQYPSGQTRYGAKRTSQCFEVLPVIKDTDIQTKGGSPLPGFVKSAVDRLKSGT